MSEHQDTTTSNTPNQPQPCRMGCGFFGSNATGDCCSKCYNELLAKEAKQKAGASKTPTSNASQVFAAGSTSTFPIQAAKMTSLSTTLEVPTAMDIDRLPSSGQTIDKEERADTAVPIKHFTAEPKLKKKKKKTSYKSMMAGMMHSSQQSEAERDAKEVDKIRSVTGGGQFTKVDKI